MLKTITILSILLTHVVLTSSAVAKAVELKGANGQIVKFIVQSVQADGIQAQREGSHKSMLIEWEYLDLEWIQRNKTQIWQEKLKIEAMKRIAYKGFKFGQTRSEVYTQMNAMKAEELSPEIFNETDPRAMWVIFDPETLRQFGRFTFDGERLVEIQIRMNFPENEAVERGMKTEWERLLKLVDQYQMDSIESKRFPSSSDWKRWTNNPAKRNEGMFVTNLWSDETRTAELGLDWKVVDLSITSFESKRITLFGVAADVTSTKTNCNWVVYTAKQIAQ